MIYHFDLGKFYYLFSGYPKENLCKCCDSSKFKKLKFHRVSVILITGLKIGLTNCPALSAFLYFLNMPASPKTAITA